MPDNTKDLVLKIKGLVDQPNQYDAFIAAWQTHLSSDIAAGDRAEPSLIEREASAAMAAMSEGTDSNLHASQGAIPVEGIGEPALVVNGTGFVETVNDLAWARYGIEVGRSINQLPVDLDKSEDLASRIISITKAGDSGDTYSLTRCHDRTSGTRTAIVFLKTPSSGDGDAKVLMIVISGESAGHSARLLTDGCDLTKSEHLLLKEFLAGLQLAEIAKARQRSVTTIRNQMQSIFEKTGCSSQSELMRLGFSLTHLTASVSPLLENVRRSNNRAIKFMRPDGRMVDVVMAGDPGGETVISLPSIFGHPLTPQIEAQLAKANIRMLCLTRPGMGETDPAPEGMSEAECVAQDILAVLDQLQVDKCAITGRASAARLIFRLCGLIPSRFSQASVVNAVLPSVFAHQDRIKAPWTLSLMTAVKSAPAVATLILQSGRRLMRLVGVRQFIARMYAGSEPDKALLNDPDIMRSIEEGARMISIQGFEAGSSEMIRALSDWSGIVEKSKVPVVLIQGTYDPNVPLYASNSFAKAYRDYCDLVVLEDGGGLINYSHSQWLIDNVYCVKQDGLIAAS